MYGKAVTWCFWKHSYFCPQILTEGISRVTSSVAKYTEKVAKFAACLHQPWKFCLCIFKDFLYLSEANDCFVMLPTGSPSPSFWWGRVDNSASQDTGPEAWMWCDPAIASCACGGKDILWGPLVTLVKVLQKPLGWTLSDLFWQSSCKDFMVSWSFQSPARNF